MSGIKSLTSTDSSALVAKLSYALTGAAMEGIERTASSQGRNATLDEDSLRWAIYAGIAAHLTDEIEKQPNALPGAGTRRPSSPCRPTRTI